MMRQRKNGGTKLPKSNEPPGEIFILLLLLSPYFVIGYLVNVLLKAQGIHSAWCIIIGIAIVVFLSSIIIYSIKKIHYILFGVLYAIPISISIFVINDFPWSVLTFIGTSVVSAFLAWWLRQDLFPDKK